MYILGISAYYHDSAAVLIKDGVVLCGAEEERFTRKKHDNNFPFQAIDFCLKNSKLSIKDIDYISYYEKPLLKFERLMETFVETYPFSLKVFLKGMPEYLDYKIKIEKTIKSKLKYKGRVFFIPHHLSHASASYYASSFTSAAVLTVDGVGEYQTTALWKGSGNTLKLLKSIDFPDSLGLLYSTFTAFLGFKINEDEYKVMGLAAYGKPKYVKQVYKLIKVKEDGSFKLDQNYFGYRQTFKMWNDKFEKVFGGPRKPEDTMTQKHKDIAATIQQVTEEIYFKILNHLYSEVNISNHKSRRRRGSPEAAVISNLCLSGGVALNALANGKIYENTPFKNIYVFGAAGDSGGALGSALFTHHHVLSNNKRNGINDLYFGSSYKDRDIESELNIRELEFKKFKSEKEMIYNTAKLLSQGKIIGWFQGKMEFGPRALGARSILSSPNPRRMKEKVNIIKIREQFRPFAGSILQEKVHEYFNVPEKNHWSPFMIFCFKVKKEKRKELAAIVHEDNTCRIQTVNKEDNGRYYKLIKEFYRLTNIPCVLNTSFNLKGEPIVENPKQAIEDFLKTKMDYLVIGDYLVPRVSDRG